MRPTEIVYVASRWGEPSQTFVRREAEAMGSAGVRLWAQSLKRPVPGGPIEVVTWLDRRSIATGFAKGFASHPVRVAKLLAPIIRRSRRGNIAPQLAAAAIGVAWCGAGVLPPGHLHAHFGWVAATATWAAAAFDDRTYSVSLHAFEIHDRRYVDGFTPLPLRGASAVFTESERDRSIVSERFGVEVTVAHLGVPTAWLEADPAVPREEDLIVAVGRLVEKKGYPVLLRAVAAATTPWRLRIIGEGPDRPELERLCRELGLTDRVSLPGAGSEAEVQGALRSASIACLASVETASGDRDGTPMALIESMASGAAVVAADTGSIAELLGDAGIVVPAGDVTALAAALDELADPTRRAELGRRGRRRVAEGWTADRTAATVLDALSAAGPSR